MTDLANTPLEDLALRGVFEGIRKLQYFCHQAMRKQGFHDEGDRLKSAISAATIAARNFSDDTSLQINKTLLETASRDRAGNRMFLIAGEVTEAHEELRAGRAPDEVYYSYAGEESSAPERDGVLGKPEGIPAELADVVIRILDYAGEYEIDLAGIIQQKIAYNASRAKMHGRRF